MFSLFGAGLYPTAGPSSLRAIAEHALKDRCRASPKMERSVWSALSICLAGRHDPLGALARDRGNQVEVAVVVKHRQVQLFAGGRDE